MSDAFSIVSASELSVKYGAQVIFNDAKISIKEGERVGLVGRNGVGKSTFLKILAGVDQPDSGTVSYRRDLVVGYLPQNFDLDESLTVEQNILAGASHITKLLDEYEQNPNDGERSGELLDLIAAADGWEIESRAKMLMNHLNTPPPQSQITSLSGGEQRRVALARTLLAQPDFLILDEPTNHLDTEAIEWQESFLQNYRGTCLFVTHDRYFLDRIATRIIELTNQTFIGYEGNYTDFLLTRAQRLENEARSEHKRQRFLTKELDWVRRRPKARGTKAKDRIDRFFEVKSQDAPEQEVDVELIIPPAGQLSNRVIEVENASISFGEKTLFSKLNFKLEPKERIGVVGRNGLGKSTLLKVILGMIEPTEGTVLLGAKTDINYVDQNRLTVNEENSVFEEVGEGSETVQLGSETIGLRAYLRRFLFNEDRINTKISLLSGGERSRVLLAKILRRGGNVLVLDEPTNDLDLNTLRVLEEALEAYDGSALIVSHDRYFLNRVCTGILGFEGEGKLFYQVGNYDYYLEKRKDRQKASQQAPRRDAPSGAKATLHSPPQSQPRKLKLSEEKELETIEAELLAAEEYTAQKEAELAHPDFYAQHSADWKEHEAELAARKGAVAALYEKWEELERVKNAWEAWKGA